METKLLPSLSAAMKAAGLRDGMTISFHHHLRNGDYILNLVLEEAARMGVRDLTVNAAPSLTSICPSSVTFETGW